MPDEDDKLGDDAMRDKIAAAMDDPRPSVPIEEAFERLRSYHEMRAQVSRTPIEPPQANERDVFLAKDTPLGIVRKQQLRMIC